MLRVALVVPQRNMTLPPVTGAVLAPRRVVSGGLDSFVIANAIVQEAGKYPPSTAAVKSPRMCLGCTLRLLMASLAGRHLYRPSVHFLLGPLTLNCECV